MGIVTDRFHVPDLADPSDDTPLRAEAEPEGEFSVLSHALEHAASALDDAAHHGLRRAGRNYGERISERAVELRQVGLKRLAERLEALKAALDDSQASGDHDAEVRLVTRWADAAIRVRLCQESGGA
ncbi:MAG TPA: hypothetical protein VER96_37690 [Polyangiaceae bacterium]|nr:hypothetical protein [Polyangiaceae bacterium]